MSKREKPPTNYGHLSRLKEHFVLIYGTDQMFDMDTGLFMRVSAARHAFGNEPVKMWLTDEGRRTVLPDQVVFDPTSTCSDQCVNLFKGIALKRKRGDVAPIRLLLEHLCDQDEDLCDWVLNWLALPLQRLGTKMRTAVIVHGDEGSGKNLFFEIIRDIYGEYGMVIGQDQLEDKFNDWVSRKLFLLADEVVTRQEMRHHKGKIKAIVTGCELQINTKMMPLRREANHVNFVFLSNERQPFELDASDRRYCVLWTPPKRETAFYQAVGQCLAQGGREAFYDFLLSRDLSGFDEFTPPPLSQAKAELIELGLKPQERFLREWVQGLLPLPLRPCLAEQVFRAFRRWCNSTGVRWSGEQAAFTNTLIKAGRDHFTYKVVTLNRPDRGRKSVRCFIPHGAAAPADYTSEGDWVGGCVEAFEDDLARFTDSDREMAA